MSPDYIAPEQFVELQGLDNLQGYQFGDHLVFHYFCKTCGISPFHDGTENPGHYRINLGCVDGLDLESLTITKIDGASF